MSLFRITEMILRVKGLSDNKGIGNTCVGLSGYEMKLFYKKMKQMGYVTKGV